MAWFEEDLTKRRRCGHAEESLVFECPMILALLGDSFGLVVGAWSGVYIKKKLSCLAEEDVSY